jgi:signal transduction histidine kinase
MSLDRGRAELSPWLQSLDECRTQTLRILAAGQLGLSWVLVVPYVIALPDLGWAVLALFVGALGALALARSRYRSAAFLLVLSQLAGATIALRVVGAPLAEWSLALVVAAAAVLLGTGWGAGVAALATTTIFWEAGGPTPWTDGLALQGIAMAWTILFTTWLGLRPLRQALSWAMNSHLDARTRAEDAERHRGELGRLVKSLSETHERLERLTSELARARLAAENARVLKARFAAYVSHELRTPLNLIIGFSEMMVLAPHTYGGEVLPAAYRGDLDAVYQSARHLATLINDVLDLSQIDAHRMALDREDVRIDAVIGEAVSTVEAAYAEKGLVIHLTLPSDLPVLYVDRTRIRQVLINLLANSLRFTEHGGVTVAASNTGSDVIVSVRDTGAGIPADELPRLFDDFRQAERPDPEPHEGSGLGLAIARRFVGLHGGWMPGHRRLLCPADQPGLRGSDPTDHRQ